MANLFYSFALGYFIGVSVVTAVVTVAVIDLVRSHRDELLELKRRLAGLRENHEYLAGRFDEHLCGCGDEA